jgi:hypothetical protein
VGVATWGNDDRRYWPRHDLGAKDAVLNEPTARYSISEGLDLLERAPARIAAASAGASAKALLEPLEPGGWSARDILGHIRACDRTWGGYILRILEDDHPTFRAESPRSTIHRTDVLDQPFAVSLAAFTDDRARLMARLCEVDAAAFARTAAVKIPARGIEERSALYYVDRMAAHEEEHVRHLERSGGGREAR